MSASTIETPVRPLAAVFSDVVAVELVVRRF
jgi:hypothetical protein